MADDPLPNDSLLSASDLTPPNDDVHNDALPPNDNNEDVSDHVSLCSTTSEESLASSSASVSSAADNHEDAFDSFLTNPLVQRRTRRAASFSYDELVRRPRSNPRTRTPRRNPSPLLGGLTPLSLGTSVGMNLRTRGSVATVRVERMELPVRSGNTRNSRVLRGRELDERTSQAVSAVAAAAAANRPTENAAPQPQQQRTATIRLNAGAAVGTLPTRTISSRININSDTSTATNNIARSSKQGPSHRKIRRWTNDSITAATLASDILRANQNQHNSRDGNNTKRTQRVERVAQILSLDGHTEEERRQYEMPNVPRQYRSVFGTLCDASTVKIGDDDDDDENGNGDAGETNAIDQEVRNRRRKMEEKRRCDLLITRERFVKGEIALDPRESAQHTPNNTSNDRFSSGQKMLEHIEPRIGSLLHRAVISSPFAVRALSSFEEVLVHGIKMASEESQELLGTVLTSSPVFRSSDSDTDDGNRGGEKKKKRGGGKTMGGTAWQFHFASDEGGKSSRRRNGSRSGSASNGSGSNNSNSTSNNGTSTSNNGTSTSNNGGFVRLLLHAVCQFHGMRASSATITRNDRMERVVTVAGICRGRRYRIVEEVKLSSNGDEAETRVKEEDEKNKEKDIRQLVSSLAVMSVV